MALSSNTRNYSDFKNLFLSITTNILNAVTTDLSNNNMAFFRCLTGEHHLNLLKSIIGQYSKLHEEISKKNRLDELELFKYIEHLEIISISYKESMTKTVTNPTSKENLGVAFDNCINTLTSIKNIAMMLCNPSSIQMDDK